MKSKHKPVSKNDFHIIMGPLYLLWTSEKGQLNWIPLTDFFCRVSYFTSSVKQRAELVNLLSGAHISGSICWSQSFNCSVGVKGWLAYDSAKFCMPERNVLFIAGINVFKHIVILFLSR